MIKLIIIALYETDDKGYSTTVVGATRELAVRSPALSGAVVGHTYST